MKKITKTPLRHWKLILAWNKIVLGLTIANIAFLPRVWTSKAQLILPNANNNIDSGLGKSDNLEDEEAAFSQQINPLNIISSIVTSDRVMKTVWEKDPQKKSYEQISDYKKLFNVSPEKDSTVISLSAKGFNPKIAQERAQNLIASFNERLQKLRKEEVISQSEFIQEEIIQANQKMIDAQKKMNQFKEARGLVSDENYV